MPLQPRHAYTAEFDVASPLALSTSFGVAPKGACAATRPRSIRFEPVELLRGFHTGFLRIPSRLVCRTRAV
jgi:hypothetical protein